MGGGGAGQVCGQGPLPSIPHVKSYRMKLRPTPPKPEFVAANRPYKSTQSPMKLSMPEPANIQHLHEKRADDEAKPSLARRAGETKARASIFLPGLGFRVGVDACVTVDHFFC